MLESPLTLTRLLAFALFACALLPGHAVAHGPEILLSTEPSSGAALDRAPGRVTLRFDTELDAGASRLWVTDSSGKQVDSGDGGVDLDDPDHASLRASLPALPHGVYSVKWQAAVFNDGDIIDGHYSFSVGVPNQGRSGIQHHGHTSHEGRNMAMAPASAMTIDTAPARLSDEEYFRVSFASRLEPIAINQMHSWVLHVDTADGRPVENARIEVDGGMPAHDHGLPTAPRVTRALGNGDYLVEGLKFHMHGRWVVEFAINAGDGDDNVSFDLSL